MAINKKLIHFKNKQTFELEVANGNILDSSIVFIKDSKEIYTHGTYYSSAVDLSEYLTISAANSKYLTISNAANTYLTISNAANTYLPIGNYITSIPTANGTTAGIVKQGGDVTISNGVISVVDDSHNHIISNVDGLQTTLDGKVSTSRTINGKALTTNITLSAADVSADASGSANSALSSAKSYTDTKISELVGLAPDALNTVYELAEAMESNQDAVDLLNTAIGNKVDKVSGKGLSTNDYTTTEKNKLAGIASGAEVNQNAFSNVTVGETTISADSKTDTLTLVAGSNVTITPDATNDKITIAAKDTTYSFSNENPTLAWGTKSTIGTVGGTALTVTMPSNPNSHYSTAIKAGASETNSNASVTNPYIKVLDNATYKSLIRLVGSGATTISSDSSGNITISSTNTTYGEASSSTAGLMSSTDKAKLDGIASGANKYSLPLAASGTRGGIQLGYSASGANVPVAVSSEKAYVALTKTAVTSALGYTPPTTNTTYNIATNSVSGLIKPWYNHTAASTGPTAGSDTTAVSVNSISTTSGRYYALEMDSNGRGFVNVPWNNTTYSSLKNPNSLAIQYNGTASYSYDGSVAKTLNIKAGSNITVTGDSSGNITIAGTPNTTYTAGKGLTLSSTTFNVGAGTGISVGDDTISVNYGTVAGTACQGNDSRLSDARPASDVYSWAKASTKPTYTYSEVGAAPASHTHSYLPLSGGSITTNKITMGSVGLPLLGGNQIATNNLGIGCNGIGISGTDTRNDGAAIYIENSGTESNKLIIALGDDSAQGGTNDYIAFRYYSTSGNATYESKVPFKSGTIALTSDIPTNTNQLTNGSGYITGITKSMVTTALGYTPPTSDTNTHYTTRIYAGASGTAANATATSPYVKITDDNTYRNQIRLIGSGATTVTSDDSGNITINSTNTTYSAGDGISLSSGKFSHADTSTLSGSYGPTADVTGNNNATIVIPQITVDAYGHVTGVTNRTYTSKDSNTTYSAITASELSTGTATTARSVTAKVIADYVNGLINSKIAAADAMIYKGTLGTNGTITALPATHTTGWTYKVITAGTYAGKICEVGDMIICLTDGTAANDAHWTVILTNVDGAVVGPASSTDAAVAVFNGTTGKVIKNSGFTIGKSVPSNAVFTDTWRSVTDSVSTTSSSTGASATAVKTAYDKAVSAYNLANGKTSNTGTVTSVATGVGLTGGSITTSGTVKAKLRSETALTIDSAAATTTSGRVYPVAVDKTGYLAVNVPWTNTTYSFTNKAATLAWNSAVTVATVGGTDITVKLPANPNSDTKVTLTVTTTNANYPLLFAPSGLTATTTTTSYFSTGIYANASTKSLYATNFYTTSDRQFKTNIERILTSDNCPVVKQFDWKETGTRSYGFIAQELEELGYEELVDTDESGVKTVNYNAALSLVVGKMLARIEELERKILELESRLN